MRQNNGPYNESLASIGVQPADWILDALRAAQDRMVLPVHTDESGALERVKRVLRESALALVSSVAGEVASDDDDELGSDTVMAFSAPDQASMFEAGFRGQYQAEFDYFSAIEDPSHKRKIEAISKRAFRLVAQLSYEVLRNGIAWCWVKLKQDIADVVEHYGLQKLEPGSLMYPEFLSRTMILCWTYNGSVVALSPGRDGFDLLYEAICLRSKFLMSQSGEGLQPSARFDNVGLEAPVRVRRRIRTTALVTSKIRAIYWGEWPPEEHDGHFFGHVKQIGHSFEQRTSRILEMSKQDPDADSESS